MASIQEEAGTNNVPKEEDHIYTKRVDKRGNIIKSNDPTIRDDARPRAKLMGDVKGAVHGLVGSVQAATGAVIRNKNMQEKGLEKMSQEDHRLGVKRGVMPVGASLRNHAVPAEEHNT